MFGRLSAIVLALVAITAWIATPGTVTFATECHLCTDQDGHTTFEVDDEEEDAMPIRQDAIDAEANGNYDLDDYYDDEHANFQTCYDRAQELESDIGDVTHWLHCPYCDGEYSHFLGCNNTTWVFLNPDYTDVYEHRATYWTLLTQMDDEVDGAEADLTSAHNYWDAGEQCKVDAEWWEAEEASAQTNEYKAYCLCEQYHAWDSAATNWNWAKFKFEYAEGHLDNHNDKAVACDTAQDAAAAIIAEYQ